MHELDDSVILQDLLETADESCPDRAVVCHHVKNEADGCSIHLHVNPQVGGDIGS